MDRYQRGMAGDAISLHWPRSCIALNSAGCLLWWVMGCILLFTVYGGLLLFYLEHMPGQVASTIPDLLTVVHEVVVLWQCITVLSSVLPLFCLWVTLVHFIWVRPANADRTRIPFNPRR